MPRIRLALLALATAVAGCGELTFGSALGEGTFVLRTVAGQQLPAPVRTDAFGGEYLADTLRFEPLSLALFAGPTVERMIVERQPAGARVQRVEFVAYERDGNNFQFSYPCGPDIADCMVGILSGTLSDGMLEVTAHPNSGLRSPLVYERIQ